MASGKRIPIPWAYRWRRFRHGILPVLSFSVCAVLTLFLWERQTRLPNAIGQIEAIRVDVVAVADGLLAPPAGGEWMLFDEVTAGQRIARLDDRPAQAELQALRAELARLDKELDAAEARGTVDRADRRDDHLRERTRLAWQVERHRLEALDRRAQIEVDRIRLRQHDVWLESIRPGVGRRVATDIERLEEELQRAAVAKRIEENTASLKEVERHVASAEQRLRDYPPLESVDVTALLGPIRASIAGGESRIRQLEVEIALLTIHAPIDGRICAIHRRVGQHVRPGDPIVTIAAQFGRHIVSYVRQPQRLQPVVGMPVDVRLRLHGSRSMATVVQRVGPQVELIPPRQCRDPREPEWGLPVTIALPPPFQFEPPGELIDVTFKPPSG